jgi:hypothetical protein
MGGLDELYLATNDVTYLNWAVAIGNLVTTQLVSANVVFYEPEEGGDGLRSGDETKRWPEDDCAWKGALVRNMRQVHDSLIARGGNTGWMPFFHNQVDSMIRSDRSAWAEFGLHWAGPLKKSSYVTFASQQSAVDALTANLGL